MYGRLLYPSSEIRYGTVRNDRLTMDLGFMYGTVLRKCIFTVPYLLFVNGIGTGIVRYRTVLPLLWPLPCTVQYVIFALYRILRTTVLPYRTVRYGTVRYGTGTVPYRTVPVLCRIFSMVRYRTVPVPYGTIRNRYGTVR